MQIIVNKDEFCLPPSTSYARGQRRNEEDGTKKERREGEVNEVNRKSKIVVLLIKSFIDWRRSMRAK